MKKFTKIITMIMAIAMILTSVNPMPAQAASKKANNITISSKTSDLTVTKVKTNKYNVTVTAGVKNAQLLATAGKKNVSKACIWKSSNKKIMTVKNNKLTAKKAGKCKVTVTYKGKKTVLNVTVTKATKTTSDTKKKCDHDWEEHWRTLELSFELPEGSNGLTVCSCGIFTTQEAALEHLSKIMLYSGAYNSQEKMCGVHGTKMKSRNWSEFDEDGIETQCIKTEYIDYMTCKKCNLRVSAYLDDEFVTE